MKQIKILLLTVFVASISLSFKADNSKEKEFDKFFEDKTLRVDYELVGDAMSEKFILKQMKKEAVWSGTKQLFGKDYLDYGNYRFIVSDSATMKVLYKKGFCSLFNEWQTTNEAKKTVKAYYHVNNMPFPKKTIKYVLEKRSFNDGKFYTVKEFFINPKNYFIINESPLKYKYTTIRGNKNECHKKIDIAFVAEGYTKEEMTKFRNDVEKIWKYISTIPPFSKHKQDFNIYAIESESLESGTDSPGDNIYKNTILNSSFYTFNTARYLTTQSIKTLHNISAIVPHDQIFIVINTSKYGGGGFYNYYSSATADNDLSLKVAIHEFGHGFAGLADEYYSSDVAYDGFYNLKVEPWEPNITTLVNFKTKWKTMVEKGVDIPTKPNKGLNSTVGVYEGGGYSAKGVYRPFQDCRMKANVTEGFCPVCTKAIEKVINYNTGKSCM